MTNNNYIESIKSIVDAHHTQYGKFLRRPENKHLLEFIEQYEQDKLKDNNLQTKVYWILNDIHDYPKCHNPNCPHHLISISEQDWTDDQERCKMAIHTQIGK